MSGCSGIEWASRWCVCFEETGAVFLIHICIAGIPLPSDCSVFVCVVCECRSQFKWHHDVLAMRIKDIEDQVSHNSVHVLFTSAKE